MRTLTNSEKRLLGACGAIVLFVGNGFAFKWRNDKLRALGSAIAANEETSTTDAAFASESGYWLSRQRWLDAKMPLLSSAETAQTSLLEHLQAGAGKRKLEINSQSLAKPESTPHFQEVSVVMESEGVEQDVLQWLAELQSPEAFHAVKYLSLQRDTGPQLKPQLDCRLVLARRHRTGQPTPADAKPPLTPDDVPAPEPAMFYDDLIGHSPFRRFLSLSDTLVLTGVARLPDGPYITIFDQRESRTYKVTGEPNAQGWKLMEVTSSNDLAGVTAVVRMGGEDVQVRFLDSQLRPEYNRRRGREIRPGKTTMPIEAFGAVDEFEQKLRTDIDALTLNKQKQFIQALQEYMERYPDASAEQRERFALVEMRELAPPPPTVPLRPKATPPAVPAQATPAAPAQASAVPPQPVPPAAEQVPAQPAPAVLNPNHDANEE